MVNSRIQGSLQLTYEKMQENGWHPYLLEGKGIHIEKCSFLGINNIFESNTVELCLSTFRHCSNIYRCSDYFSLLCLNKTAVNERTIKDCRFEFCRSIGEDMPPQSRFKSCQFNHCFSILIQAGAHGGLMIQNCEFNLSEMRVEENGDEDYFKEAMINLNWCQGDITNQILDCAFFGIKAHQAFIIQSSTLERLEELTYVTNIRNCIFRNCTTERPSGAFFNTYGSIFDSSIIAAWGELERQEVTSVFDCKIENTMHPDGYCMEIIPMTTNAAGIPLGVASALENKAVGCAER